jgi:4-hydroxy-2-oxoglutarate aldolase
MRFDGVLAPICTPFAAAGEVDHAALRRNLAKYCHAGLQGFVVAGSTGEAAFLGKDEKLKLFQAVSEAAPGKTLIAGAGVESVRETVGLIAAAAALGFHAALVLTPHYYRAQMSRPETQLAFFRAVADASALPVLIYNFPQMTGVDLPAALVAQLAEHPNIMGIKESSADLDKVASLTAALSKPFQVLVGSSVKFHDCLRLGAIGGILAIANALPRSARRIYDRFDAGDVEGSAAAQRQIVEAAGVAPRYGIQGLKYAMDRKGYFGGQARLPLLPLDDAQKAEIDRLFDAVGD